MKSIVWNCIKLTKTTPKNKLKRNKIKSEFKNIFTTDEIYTQGEHFDDVPQRKKNKQTKNK